MKAVGLGCENAEVAVYIGNRPPLDVFTQLSECRFIRPLEINQIAELTGNHWRKIFNCYAKLSYAINAQGFLNWQTFRDQFLLQEKDRWALFFSPPDLNHPQQIKIVCGKTHFQTLVKNHQGIVKRIRWLDKDFAIDSESKLIVSPYFDYRQLSNIKIQTLVSLIHACQKIDEH